MEEVSNTLSTGSQIAEFRIIDILGIGGFGITYKAQDTRLDRLVAIKEFLPIELAARGLDSKTVMPRTNVADDYKYGLKKFLDEAKTLAKFNHPNIVKVLTFLEENGTAYLVMEYVEGEALDEHLKKIHFNGNMAESRIREIIEPLLKGLAQVHKAGLLHRDIKPGNIYLQNSSDSNDEHGNNPMLIDFGAARQSVGEKSKSISAIISQGYAPPEQYTTRGKQGPYTDIYAIGAVMYYLVTGTKPVESTDRQHEIMDELPDPLIAIEKNRGYSDALVQAITQAIVLRISNRVQSVSALQNILFNDTNTPYKQSEQECVKSKITEETVKIEREINKKQTENKQTENKQTTNQVIPPDIEIKKNSQSKKSLIFVIVLIFFSAVAYFAYDNYQQELVLEAEKIEKSRELYRENKAKEVRAADKKEQERLAKVVADKKEQERLAKVVADKKEQERLAKVVADKKEQERLAKVVDNKYYSVIGIRFFEGQDTAPDLADRDYKNTFRQEQAKRIWTELELKNVQYNKRSQKHEIKWIYYNPDGSVQGKMEKTINIEKDIKTSVSIKGWGWKAPGNWNVGTYKVKVFIDEIEAAEKHFTIRAANKDYSVTGIKFYEGGTDTTPYEERQYETSFHKGTTKLIWTELKIKNFRYNDKKHEHDIKWVYYDKDGGINHTMVAVMGVEPEWKNAHIPRGWGFKETGKWENGAYKVKVFMDGLEVAEETFVIHSKNEEYKFTSIRFFESDDTAPADDDRVFSSSFSKNSSRRIWTELKVKNLKYKEAVQEHNVKWVYYDNKGDIDGTMKATMKIQPEWESARIQKGWGYKSAGQWKKGTYKVKVYIDGVKVGEQSYYIE